MTTDTDNLQPDAPDRISLLQERVNRAEAERAEALMVLSILLPKFEGRSHRPAVTAAISLARGVLDRLSPKAADSDV